MTRQKWTSVFVAILFLFTSEISVSQTNKTFKRNAATVLFASLGGAILGLSTLSFYGEPQEHTNNITLGALLGFSAGLGYVVYNSSPVQPNYEYSQVLDIDRTQRRGLAFTKSPLLTQITIDF
ncbi:MAG: hypothetical protein ACXVCY_01250 [Pseudobdellovibrionaceae bacterium]